MNRRATRAALVLAGCGLLLAACSSGPKSPSSTTSTQSANTTTTPTTSSTVSGSSVPNSVPNVVPDRKDVLLSGCVQIPGGWKATGTARNPGSTPKTFNLTIFFTTAQATDVTFTTTSVTVAPGKTAAWTAQKTFAVPSPLNCVLRGVS